jgi:pimeloyl-ACP methyl ester carboxylesterase
MAGEGTYRGGSGEPLVLIHGFSASWRVWKPVLPALEARHDVLAVGLAGHFDCAALPDGVEPSVAALIDALERDMDAAGFETAHLAGNSLGGWLALELAMRGRARSVVAIAPAGGWQPGSREERRLEKLFRRNHKLLSRLGGRAERMARSRLGRWLLMRQAVARPSRIGPEEAVHSIQAFAGCPIYFQLLDAILRDGPPVGFDGLQCLLVWPARDRILLQRRYSQRLRDLLPAAEFRVLPAVGHVPMSDNPDLVARTILGFTETQEARPLPTSPARP